MLSDNRKARFDYHLMERFEAGLALTGTEVKAARDGKVQLREGFAEIAGNEAWLVNVHISHYKAG
ncbi:MAG: SsrA-binding protein, partial [bacterium]|nr:SsrA-binding protein [bacterium]